MPCSTEQVTQPPGLHSVIKKKKILEPMDAEEQTAGPGEILRFLEALGAWVSIPEITSIWAHNKAWSQPGKLSPIP